MNTAAMVWPNEKMSRMLSWRFEVDDELRRLREEFEQLSDSMPEASPS